MNEQRGSGQEKAPAEQGQETAFPELYDELRRLAAHCLATERRGHTLQATALVHEVWLRLAKGEATPINRGQFYAAAATAMRRILINHARDKHRIKRGGDAERVALDVSHLSEDKAEIDLLSLDEALDRLGEYDQRKARLVELRYFGGLDNESCAEALGISLASVKREWTAARAWLMHFLA